MSPEKRWQRSTEAGCDSRSPRAAGSIEIKGDQILLGAPFVFDKKNIDAFNFEAII